MILEKGITGFCDEKTLDDFGQVDYKLFRSICYDIALQADITLVNIVECDYPFTYHKAIFNVNGERILLLVNAYYPIAGFAKNDDPFMFCDIPSGFESLQNTYDVLDEDALLTYPTAKQLEGLDASEHEQLRFWKPRNLGEIIFNVWD